MVGRVVSVKSKNTVTVLIERVAKHPLYKKTYLRSKKYLVDDQIGVKEGDLVDIINCKPVSKNKHWKVMKVVGQNLEEITEKKLKKAAAAVVAEVMPEEKQDDQIISESVDQKEIEKPTRPSKGSKSKRKEKTSP